ncbi:MAG: aldose 1-epimerase family protein [Stackebrandtia sp.]
MALSGDQWTISYSGREAVIASVGGGLRSFSVDGVHYVDGYGDDEIAPGWAGHVLAPWPGRLGDGVYTFEGETHRLAWNDPDTRSAMHGLVGWMRWQAADVSDSSVTVECALPAQPGYPFPLVLRTRWSLGPYGLRAAHTVSNVGTRPCPFGLGVHPYVMAGDRAALSTWRLRVPAKTRLTVNERGLPTGEETAQFVEPAVVGEAQLDCTFGELIRDADRVATLEVLSASEDRGVTVWVDESFGWLHVYTGDALPNERRRRALAVEPMTCPPDALRSGAGLVTLGPGELWSGTWGISPRK